MDKLLTGGSLIKYNIIYRKKEAVLFFFFSQCINMATGKNALCAFFSCYDLIFREKKKELRSFFFSLNIRWQQSQPILMEISTMFLVGPILP